MPKEIENREALPARSRSVRRRLFRDLAILLLVIVGAMLAFAIVLGGRVKTGIATSWIERATQESQKSFSVYFDSLERGLVIAQRWGQSGMLDLTDVRLSNAEFIPILEEMQIQAVMIGRSDGASYFLRQEDDAWVTRTTQPETGVGEESWQRWSREEELLDAWTETSGYDPRKRPWFQGALDAEKANQAFWTRPYVFSSTKTPGISVSMAWREAKTQDRVSVICFDVPLDAIYDLLSGLEVGGQGRAFLFTEDGLVFDPLEGNASDGDVVARSSYLVPADRYGVPAVTMAVEQCRQGRGAADRPVEFMSQGKRWWAGFSPLSPDAGPLWFGVVVPEDDFLGGVKKSPYVAAFFLVAILGVGIVMAVLIVKRYSHNLRDLPNTSLDRRDLETALLSLIEEGEGNTVEFKTTMRMNLKTGKQDKEIELAWLKTVTAFMNTAGGILLVGVDDDGDIQGIEADGFANEDKCRLHFKNLIAQHIGIEHSGSLNFEIHPVKGRQLIFIECERAEKPAFLTHRNEEGFYIRSGPSSVKLPVSKVLQYLESRK